MVPSQKFYESSSPTIFVCWFLLLVMYSLMGGISNYSYVPKRRCKPIWQLFFFFSKKKLGEKPTDLIRWWRSLVGWNAGRGSWNEGADGGKKDLELVLGRFAQPFFVVQRLKKGKNTADYGQTWGMFPDDWLIHQNGWLEYTKYSQICGPNVVDVESKDVVAYIICSASYSPPAVCHAAEK